MSVTIRVLGRLLRWSLWLFAGLFIMAALYVSLGRQLTPLMAEYREEIEQQLEQRLQQSVQIEQLTGRWRGFSPLLEARYVTLGEGDDALQVDSLLIQPDVVNSLLAREIRFKAVTLTGLQINLQQDQQGHWALQGLELHNVEHAAFQLNDWLIRLRHVAQLSILDSRIIIQAFASEPLVLRYAGFTLSRTAQQQRLDLRAVLPDGETVELSAQGQLIGGDWRKSRLAVYLKTPRTNLARWVPQGLLGDNQLSTLSVGGVLWLHAAQGQLQRAVLRLDNLEVEGQAAHAEPLHLYSRNALAFYQNESGLHSAWLENFALQLNTLPERDMRMSLTYGTDDAPVWQLALEQLDLTDVHYVMNRLWQLPDVGADVLNTLQPSGTLHHVQLQWRPEAALSQRLTFDGNLSEVAFSAWRDVPASSGISGRISGDLAQGELRLATDTGFSLHLAKLFAQPWQYQRAHAQLLWQFDEQGFTLQSPYLQVHGEEGEIGGDFLIRLLKDPAEEDYMDLRVGLRDGDARFTSKYLPSRVPTFSDELERWLNSAIAAGHVEQGYFQYQGSLNKGAAPESRSISLYFAVKEAQLEYQPGWPALKDAVAQVLIEDSGVRIYVEQGLILESPVTAAYAQVVYGLPGQVPVLQLHAELQSSVADGLYFLQNTPIALGVPEFARWHGQGDLPVNLDVSVPLAAHQTVHIKLDMDAQRVTLDMPDINVELSQLSGLFTFDSQQGLSSERVTGEFLGQTFNGRIDAKGTGRQLRTHIDVQGQMPIEQLAQWAAITQPLPVSGHLPYRLRLLLEGEDSQLRIDSSLLGVNVDLPAPFGKTAGQQRYADWRMTLTGAERRYWFDYADQLSLSLAAAPNDILSGRAQLRVGGGLARLPTQAGLHVRGRLNRLDLADWQPVLQRYNLSEQGSRQLLKSAKLEIQNLNAFGLQADNLTAHMQPQKNGWQVLLDSQQLKGQIVHRGDTAPIAVHFTHLYMPDAVVQPVLKKDALATFDMRRIPALDVQLDALYYGQSHLGGWSFNARPQPDGVLFDKLQLSLKGLNVNGQAGWQHSNGRVSSWYAGRLSGDNLSDVLLAWGFAPTVTSQAFSADADVRWAGSPTALSLKALSGDVDISFRNGQLVTVDGGAQALRVFGLLNFDSIGRRLRLDFSDLIDKGLAYDRIKGRLQVHNGVYRTDTSLNLTGPSSDIELQGQIDLANEIINAKMQVALPLSNNLPLAAIVIGAPAIGGALFIVDRLIGDRLSRFASVTYHISGDWQNPEISLGKKSKK